MTLSKKLLEEDKNTLIANNKARIQLSAMVASFSRRNARLRERIMERETIIRVAEGKAAQAEREERRSGYERQDAA